MHINVEIFKRYPFQRTKLCEGKWGNIFGNIPFLTWNSFSFICNLIYVVNFIVIGFCLSHQFHPLCVGFPLMFNLILELQFHPCCWSSSNDSFTHTWVYVVNLIHNHDLFICSITCDKFHQWNFHKHSVKNQMEFGIL